MRLFGAVVMIAGMVWLMVGCGGVAGPPAGGAKSGLTLADAESGTQYNLSVADGSLMLMLTGAGSAEAPAMDSGLIDRVTGSGYQVGVTNGALMLEPGAGGAAGVEEIGLADTVTAKTYELAVASGSLTLTANEEQ